MSAALIWFMLGVAFLLAELMTPALVLIFFGAGCWAASLAALLGFGLNWQLAAFIVVTLLTLLVLRRRLRAIFGGRSQANASGSDEKSPAPHPLTDQQGVVSKALRPGEPGEVSVGGSFWRAVAQDPLEPGQPVLVLGAAPDNTLLLRVAAVGPSAVPAGAQARQNGCSGGE